MLMIFLKEYLPWTLTRSVPLVSIPSISGTVTTHMYVPAVSNVAFFRIKVWPFEISSSFYTHKKAHLSKLNDYL